MSESFQWKEIQPNVFQRPCSGQENAASFNQNVADGHTELSISIQFDTNIPQDELLKRIRLAWIALRISHPECCVELSTDLSDPQLMTYRLLEDEDKIQEWVNETLVFCRPDEKHEDVLTMTFNRRLPTKGKQSMLYYIPPSQDINPSHSIIWNVSHAVTDSFSITMFMQDLLEEFVYCKPELQQHRFSNNPKLALQKLPASLVDTYTKQFKPTEEITKSSVEVATQQVALYEKMLPHSVAMQPRPDHSIKKHYTHCLSDNFSPEISQRIFAYLRQQKATITFAAAAATILAVKDMYGNGKEKGALLGMTRNARSFLDTAGQKGAAIPMATDVVFLWVPFDDEKMMEKKEKTGLHSIETLLSLSLSIRKEISKHLKGPHYMASMQLMGSAFIDGLRKNLDQNGNEKEIKNVQPSPPGFSPQGIIRLGKIFEHEGKRIERGHVRHTGRQINSSPWIGMFSLDGEIHISTGFDEKYYEPEVVLKFFQNYKAYLLSLANPIQSRSTESESIASRL